MASAARRRHAVVLSVEHEILVAHVRVVQQIALETGICSRARSLGEDCWIIAARVGQPDDGEIGSRKRRVVVLVLVMEGAALDEDGDAFGRIRSSVQQAARSCQATAGTE